MQLESKCSFIKGVKFDYPEVRSALNIAFALKILVALIF